MGKAARWLKSFLGIKKHTDKDRPTKENSNTENGRKEKVGVQGMDRRWSFTKQTKGSDKENRWYRDYITDSDKEQSRHSIAVAAATAAAADAAVAAAHAAVAVVRLTTHGRHPPFNAPTHKWAAIKIQTCFRGYLARKALRALKALVKLQAYVKGYLVRKRAAATLQSMQTLIRAQVVATSQRMNRSLDGNYKLYSKFAHRRSIRCEDKRCEFHSKRLSTTSYEAYNATNCEGSTSPKIVEIDTYKPRSRSKSKRMNPSSRVVYDFEYPTMSSPLPCPTPHRLSMPGKHCDNYEWSFYGDEYQVSMTAHGIPRIPNSSMRYNGPTTPTKSVCGDSFFPNYMADTQSFRAKLRSQSAPKQRPDSQPKKKLTLDDIIAARNSISSVRMHRCNTHQVQHNCKF